MPVTEEQPPKPRLAKRLLQLLQGGGFLGLMGMSALCASARWFWFGEVAVSFRWYVGWVGLAGALLLLVTRGRWLALAAAVISVVNLAPELRLYLPVDTDVPHGTEITIASTNLLLENPHHDAYLEWIDEVRPDVVCIQEISPQWLRSIEMRREDYFPYALYSPPTEEWGPDTWGTAILSRLPFAEANLHPVVGGRLHDRPIMEAVVLLDGRRLTFRGAHPERAGKAWSNEARNRVLFQIAEMDWDGAGVAFGDLNTSSTSPAFGRMLARSGLRDSREGFGRLASWQTPAPIPGLGVAIDHILVGEDWVVLERRVDPLRGSDHHLAVARIALRRDER